MLNKHKHAEHEKHHGRHHEEHHGKRHGEHEKHHGKKCEKMKEGGYVDKGHHGKCENMTEYADKMLKRFAAGGVAKVRHGQSTADGNQLNTKRVRNTGVYY